MNDDYSSSRCSNVGIAAPEGAFPAETPLAMAYVPWQEWGDTYPENTALEKGTIFPSLDYPFYGKEGRTEYGKQ